MSLIRALAVALVRKLLPETTDPGSALALRQPARPQVLPPPVYRPAQPVYEEMFYAPPVHPLAPPLPRRRTVTVIETIYSERKW